MLGKLGRWLADPVTQDVIAALGAVLILDGIAQLVRRVDRLERRVRALSVSRETVTADA